jgi:hypothetical protein
MENFMDRIRYGITMKGPFDIEIVYQFPPTSNNISGRLVLYLNYLYYFLRDLVSLS